MVREFTLGVEEEYQLVDPESRELRCRINQLMEATQPWDEVTLVRELHQSVVEVATGICANVEEVRHDVVQNRLRAQAVADRVDLRIAAASTHPFSSWHDQTINDDTRYHRLVDELQDVARGNLIYGMHIHVGIPDQDEAIAVFNSARYFLPHLLALSTSSPFYEGRNTGLKSARSLVFEHMPRSGIPERFDRYSDFEEFVATLIATGCMETPKSVWWDLRPHPQFSTLEFRICDVPPLVEDVMTITALVQAIVVKLTRLHRRNMTWNTHRRALLNENKWRALRYGVEGRMIDFGNETELEFERVAEGLLDFVDDVLDDLGSRAEAERVFEIVRGGTSADRQLAVFHETGDLTKVVDQVLEETMRGVR